MTAPIRTMPELIEALRTRARELQLTHETIDSVSGLQSGYTGKLLAPKPIKNLGPMSFEAIMGALGVAVVVVEDPEQVKRVQTQWTKRERPLRMPLRIENEVPAIIEVTPELQRQMRDSEFMRSIGKIGGKRRLKTMGKRARQRSASHAARKRWDKAKAGLG